MKKLFKYLFLSVLIAFAFNVAYADQPVAQKQVAQSAKDIDPNGLVNAALSVSKISDQLQYASLWDGASYVAKNNIPKAKFIDTVTNTRKPLGAVVSRTWVSITRQQQTTSTPTLPAGIYASVLFASVFTGNKQISELISFRLDEDGTWRFCGLSIK